MMNDFGVPMNDAEMSMKPIKPHERLMAESGVESNWEFFASAAISTICSIIGGNKEAKAAKYQVDGNNDGQVEITRTLVGMQRTSEEMASKYNLGTSYPGFDPLSMD